MPTPPSPRALRRAVPLLALVAWAAAPASAAWSAAHAGIAEAPPAEVAAAASPETAGAPARPAADPEPLRANPGCTTWLTGEAIPSNEQLAAGGATIGKIHVRSQNIFDPSVPGEDFWAFRLANRVHVVTRDRVILNRLVFVPGDPYDERRLAESERLLRRDRFLYDATIRPVAYCDGVVDVEVTTRDVWSLKPSAGFTREGGANQWHAEVQDSNFLGFGTDLTLAYEDNVDRTATLARYRDDDFLGRRLRFELWYSDNSDGDLARLTFERPFRSLDDALRLGAAHLPAEPRRPALPAGRGGRPLRGGPGVRRALLRPLARRGRRARRATAGRSHLGRPGLRARSRRPAALEPAPARPPARLPVAGRRVDRGRLRRRPRTST